MTAVADLSHRRITWGSFAGWLFDCVLAVLVFVSLPALHNSSFPPIAIPRPASDWAADFPARVERVTAALSQMTLRLPTPTSLSQGAGTVRWQLRRYEATVPKPRDPAQIANQFAAVTAPTAGAAASVALEDAGARVQIGIDGLLTHSIALHWLAHNPQLAIVVTGLGDNLLTARIAADIEAPLTLAIRPFQPFSTEVAQLAALLHRETLLQVQAVPAIADRATIQRWLNQTVGAVPNVVGFYGLGTPAANTPAQLQLIASLATEKRWLIVPGTVPDAGICQVAASAGRAYCGRVTLLDGEDTDRVRRQISAVTEDARHSGLAVAAMPASASALAAVRAALAEIAKAGVDIVPISTAVR